MATRAQGRKRLLELAKFLREKVTDKLFDFSEVMVVGDKRPKDALKAGGGCGTVGCAMGWADVRWPNRDLINIEGWDASANDFAIAEFFGISEKEVDFLFYPERRGNALEETATRKQVAKHIEKFVAQERHRQELKANILHQIKQLKKFSL